MKILITNDDGIMSPALSVLKEELSMIADVTIVAPSEERSTTGHSLTLRTPLTWNTFNSLQVEDEKLKDQVYHVNGFPADCVIFGLKKLMNGHLPDLIISGINRGGNLGQDIYYSGTVAGAREATFCGIPAIAVSLAMEFSKNFSDSKEEYRPTAKFLKDLILNNIIGIISKKFFLNINVPYLKKPQGVKISRSGFRHYRGDLIEMVGPKERKCAWIGTLCDGHEEDLESDCFHIEEGHISINPIGIQYIEYPFKRELQELVLKSQENSLKYFH